MTDEVVFRTTDGTRWGPGQNFKLSKSQIDINFWVLLTRLMTVEHMVLVASVGIHNASVTNGELILLLTDGTQLGPFDLTFNWNFTNPPTGAWLASNPYLKNDVFTNNNRLYNVLKAHTSALTFDPNATDGGGHSLYKLMLSMQTFFSVQTHTGDWTPGLADIGTYNRFTNPSSAILTLPFFASVPFAVGNEFAGIQASTGQVHILAHSGIVLNHPTTEHPITRDFASGFTLKCVAKDEWDLIGRLATTSP